MKEYVTLLGAESVERASSRMIEAADRMREAVNNLECSLFRQQQFLDDWLNRLSDVLEEKISSNLTVGMNDESHLNRSTS